ncbi:DUF167 domain-containing protein [bacterium]|nr:MAG: DUF167 domain-containing protein [bacterium]
MSQKHSQQPGLGGAAITVRVTPRAKKNQISAILADGTIKIHLTAPPVDGKANQALIAFLSEISGLPESKIEIVAGLTGRNKLVAFTGINSQKLQDILFEQVGK